MTAHRDPRSFGFFLSLVVFVISWGVAHAADPKEDALRAIAYGWTCAGLSTVFTEPKSEVERFWRAEISRHIKGDGLSAGQTYCLMDFLPDVGDFVVSTCKSYPQANLDEILETAWETTLDCNPYAAAGKRFDFESAMPAAPKPDPSAERLKKQKAEMMRKLADEAMK